jgi:hypothetical protein
MRLERAATASSKTFRWNRPILIDIVERHDGSVFRDTQRREDATGSERGQIVGADEIACSLMPINARRREDEARNTSTRAEGGRTIDRG